MKIKIMSQFQFGRLKLLSILLLFQNAYHVNSTRATSQVTETSEIVLETTNEDSRALGKRPVETTDGGELPIPEDDLHSGIYQPFIIHNNGFNIWYFCPPETDKTLNQKYRICIDRHCLFVKASIPTHDDKIRCKYEILSSIRKKDERCGYNSNYTSYEVIFTVALQVIIEYEEITQENAQSSSKICFRGLCLPINLIIQYANPEKPNIKSQEIVTEQNVDVEDPQLALAEIPIFRFCFKHGSLQTYFTMHSIPKSIWISQSSSRSVAFTEDMWKPLKNTFFSMFDQQQSYIYYNRMIANMPDESTIAAQPFVPQEDLGYDAVVNASLFDFNVAPILTDLADLWGGIHKSLQTAAQKFNQNLIVYTGIIRVGLLQESDKNARRQYRNPDLNLIYRSYNISTEHTKAPSVKLIYPGIWFKFVGTLDSNESVIIILNNHKRNLDKSSFANCSFESSRWNNADSPIFDSYLVNHPNIAMCTLHKPIIDEEKYTTTNREKFFEQSYTDPAKFVEEALGADVHEVGKKQSDIGLETTSQSEEVKMDEGTSPIRQD